MPGLLTGAALVFLLACGAVVTPMLLGGIRARMIGQQIYQDIFQLFNFTKASALSVILLAATLIIACVLFGVLRLWERGMRPETAR
jgi:putative spermidine/putrescine transport system permease protein